MDVTLIAVTIHSGNDGYGINFRGSGPVLVDSVVPGSSAEQGGLRYGDFLLELDGNDVQSFSRAAVITAIKSNNRGTLQLRVGRVRPIPMTAEDKKMAAQLLRNKVMSGGDKKEAKEIAEYQVAVKNSLQEVEDLLGSFGLSPIKKPIQTTPTKRTSGEIKSGGQFAEEVEVPLYDSDSLPSPPSSEASDPEELDELLDFSRNDEFNYNPAFQQDYTKEGLEGPRIMKAMLQAKHGMEGIKEIISDVKDAKEKKQEKKGVAMVSTTATFVPNGSSKKQRSPQHASRDGSISGTQSAKESHAPPPVQMSKESRMPPPVQMSKESRVPPPVQMSKESRVPPPVQMSKESRVPPPVQMSKESRVPPPVQMSKEPRVPPPVQMSKESRVPPPVQMSKESRMPPPVKMSLSERGTTSPLSSPTTATYSQAPTTPTSPATVTSPVTTSVPTRLHPLATSQQPVAHMATKSNQGGVSSPTTSPTKLPSSSTEDVLSPPIPPYNPPQPDRFPLSNKQDYRLEYKRQQHSYEAVDKDAVRHMQRNLEFANAPPSPSETRGGGMVDPVLFRKKKRQGGSVATPGEMGGEHVEESHTPGTSGKLKIGKIQARGEAEVAEMPIMDLSSGDAACVGLPASVYEWRKEDVYQWLYQLSPSLYKLYKPNFVKHDIIGRSLIRLNMNKIKNMGITSNKHSRLLVMEMNRLKVRQEKMELEEMQAERQLSFL